MQVAMKIKQREACRVIPYHQMTVSQHNMGCGVTQTHGSSDREEQEEQEEEATRRRTKEERRPRDPADPR